MPSLSKGIFLHICLIFLFFNALHLCLLSPAYSETCPSFFHFLGAIGFTCAGGFGGKYLRVELFVPEVPEKDAEGKEEFFLIFFSGKYVRVELFVPEVPEKGDEGKDFFFWRKVCASGTVRA
jgi:hypothetical protein